MINSKRTTKQCKKGILKMIEEYKKTELERQHETWLQSENLFFNTHYDSVKKETVFNINHFRTPLSTPTPYFVSEKDFHELKTKTDFDEVLNFLNTHYAENER